MLAPFQHSLQPGCFLRALSFDAWFSLAEATLAEVRGLEKGREEEKERRGREGGSGREGERY